MARKVPHALRTDKNVSKLVSSLSDAHAKEGSTQVRQSNMSINIATILFFFKIYPLLIMKSAKKQRGSLRRRQAGLQRASPDISLLGSLFHRHRLGKVSGHVYITAALPCYIVSKKLQRHDRNKGEQLRLGFGCEYDIF